MNRLADIDAFDRGVLLCQMVLGGQELTSRAVVERFGVSYATAKRDLVRIERLLPVAVREEAQQGGFVARRVLRLGRPT